MRKNSERERKLNHAKWRALTFICCSFLALTLSNQNCAPLPVADENLETSDSSQMVTIIDDIKSDAGLSFKAQRLDVPNESIELTLEGACSPTQDGSILTWRLMDAHTQELAHGRAECQSGSFAIEVDPAKIAECGRDHMVLAQMGFAEAGMIVLRKQCAY